MKNYKVFLLMLLCLALIFAACSNGSFDSAKNYRGGGNGGGSGNNGEGEEEPDPNLFIPLCFEALDDNVIVCLGFIKDIYSSMPRPPVKLPTLDYAINGGEWIKYEICQELSLNKGDKVTFQGNNDSFSDAEGQMCFFFDGPVAAGGNIMSLLDKTLNSKIIPSKYCFTSLFNKCATLVSAPVLPATTLEEGCYSEMFRDCKSLKAAPKLPATTLAKFSYNEMFRDCTSLAAAPALPAQELVDSCYQFMFAGCTSLEVAPELSATKLAYCCYEFMFGNCTSLKTAPKLPATELAGSCYSRMFYGCSSLTNAPELPATTMIRSCYSEMFVNCTSLEVGPKLPAKELVLGCYWQMFQGCEKLKDMTCLATELANNDPTHEWLKNVASSGVFYKAQGVEWPKNENGVPSGWTVADYSE